MHHRRSVQFAAFVVLSSLLLPARGYGACSLPPNPSQVWALGRWQSDVGGIDSPFLIPGKRVGGAERTTALHGAAVTNTDVVSIAFLGGTGQPVLLVLANDCNAVNLGGCTDTVCRNETLAYGSAGGPPPIPWVSFTAKNFIVNGEMRAGQVRVAATSPTSIPCALKTTPCASLPTQPHVCIDVLNTQLPGAPATVTALPPPNDFSKICVAAPGTLPPCTGGGTELVMALDSRGDLNIPMDWSDIVRDNGNQKCVEDVSAPQCKKRDVSATTTVPASTSAPIQITDTHLKSLNADGEVFPTAPTFKTKTNADALELYGTADKAFSVLRILGCPETNMSCAPRAFDFWQRREPGGPVIIRRKSNGKGICKGSSAECDKNSDCLAGTGPCIGFGGVAKGYFTIPPIPPPTPVPGIVWPWVLLGLVVVALALLFVRNQQGGGS